MRIRTAIAAVAATLALVSALGARAVAADPKAPAAEQEPEKEEKVKETKHALALTSPAFVHEGAIPKKFTCEGADASPALAWSGAPEGTKTFALIVEDPDAPDPAAPKMTWVHWVLYDIPATAEGLPEAVTSLPKGTRAGENSWERTGWGGPCPPIGEHRYFFRLYALDTALGDRKQPTTKELRAAMKGHVLAEAVLMGTYEKEKK